jgi:hypothetical protein
LTILGYPLRAAKLSGVLQSDIASTSARRKFTISDCPGEEKKANNDHNVLIVHEKMFSARNSQ